MVLIGGSGPADRHNDGLFDALRDLLVEAGVAEGQRVLASYQHLAWFESALGEFALDANTWAQLR